MPDRNPAGGGPGRPEALALARAARNHAELLRAVLDPGDRSARERLDALSDALSELLRLLAGES